MSVKAAWDCVDSQVMNIDRTCTRSCWGAFRLGIQLSDDGGCFEDILLEPLVLR